MHYTSTNIKMAPNDNNNNNTTASSLDLLASTSSKMINSLLPLQRTTSNQLPSEEGRNTKISPTNSSEDCPREGISSSNSYHSIRYAHLPADNYTTIKSKNRQGRRCYRLNLERPFNIHCEQSPLEYGDIFAPWKKSVRPTLEGPVEYCPPRHLGGSGEVWRQLLSYSPTSEIKEGEVNTGWRTLTEKEVDAVKRLGECNERGEYSFVTYDLSHVKKHSPSCASGEEQPAITPSTSIDSLSSEEESTPQSETKKANDTARLFRRSELSLRDAAEEQARKDAAEKERLKAERNHREQQELAALKSIKGPKGVTKRMSKKASLNGKKMMRKLSSLGGSSSSSTVNGGIYEGGGRTRRKLVSTQAGMIDKAKDLVDDESDDEYDGEKYDDTKKIANMSLFIVGEYDVLNDLCLDGGLRLKKTKDLSDLELLLQNEPCPPPNRWVRKTGWGKCNPSSMYAECPPEDFDWESYLKKDGPVKVNPVPRPVMQKS
mmetsp:Transcript_36861/g.54208  ORF Transcript_36861/g.54208 Transcript_36861/m.54208 type:complete len:488 (-) Transcript_36861:344-1807(-)